MKDWRKSTLGELVTEGSANYQTGPFGTVLKASEFSKEGVPLISVGEIREGYIQILSSTPRVCERITTKLPKYILEEEDIVFGRKGAINRNAIIQKEQAGWFLGSDGIRLRLSDEHSSSFFSYQLRTSSIQEWLMNNGTGAIMPGLNQKILDRLPVYIPKLHIQQKIAKVLSTLDAKIELNNRINAELEGMAKLLYDYWFVQFDFPMTAAQAASLGRPDLEGHPYKSSGGKMVFNPTLKREIPDGWEVKPLEQIEDHIVTGKTPPTTDPKNFGGDIPFICIGDVRGNMHVIETQLTLSKVGAELQTKKFIPKGAICVTCIASPGLIAFATKDSQTNQQLNSIVCKNEENRMFLYFYLGDYFKHAAGAKTGNTFANMNKGDFSEINVLLPDQGLLTQFMEKVSSSESQILNHLNQNQELTELRDWLLPMLMNGQLTVG
jgi:type I restriction enzyme S subunit